MSDVTNAEVPCAKASIRKIRIAPWKWGRPTPTITLEQVPVPGDPPGSALLAVMRITVTKGRDVNRLMDHEPLPRGETTLANRAFALGLAYAAKGGANYSGRLLRWARRHGASWDSVVQYPEITRWHLDEVEVAQSLARGLAAWGHQRRLRALALAMKAQPRG